MRRLAPVAAVALLAAACAAPAPALVYPVAARSDHVDVYHGTEVPDPYRWLEDPDSAETRAWVEAENRVTGAFLAGIPEREGLRSRLTTLWNYERYGVPTVRGGRTFFSRNDGLQNQSVLWVTDTPGAEPRVLLDPNTLSADGTVALADTSPSEDGRLLAYAVASGGSDWMEWRIRDVATGKDLPEVLKWSKFSDASWTPDGKGFFYSRYAPPAEGEALRQANRFQKLCWHAVGTPQSEDPVVYERPDEGDWGFGGTVSEDGRWLAIHVWRGAEPKNRLFLMDLAGGPRGEVVRLLDDFDASYDFLGNDGSVLYVSTNLDAPRGRVVAIDAAHPARDRWREVIPQAAEAMQGVRVVGDRFVATYLKDAKTEVRFHRMDGTLERTLDLPGTGSAGGFTGRRRDRETYYSFTAFTTPAAIYRCDLESGRSEVFRRPEVDFDPADYETRQVFYESTDGTRVPMFVSHRRGLRRDGSARALLYGYGGFNNALTPFFSVSNLVWMERGGVYAVANIRGGGEYGEDWHRAALRENRPRAFEDFIAAGEWLVSEGYTSRERLAISGGSNGGLLVGACITRRPDLFGAALPAVGVLDMLRYHKFTIGFAWIPEFGSADEPADFPFLRAYSPLHNVRPGTSYPATLITTADHDDRVVPAHSFKFAATLQAAQAGPAPVLIRIETRAGHGAGKPTSKRIDESTDVLSFLMRVLR